jgi:spoIIIJ-associated protein
MSEYKSFQGKNVDDAIAEACRHFKCTREELEVEIVSGGSSGIFGLVGVKKAKVKARMREITATKPAAPTRAQSRKENVPRSKEPATPKPVKSSQPKSSNTSGNSKNTSLAETRETPQSPGRKPAKHARNNGLAAQAKPLQCNKSPQGETSSSKQEAADAAPGGTSRGTTGGANGRTSGETPEAVSRQAAVSRPAPADIDVEAARQCILESTRILLTNISEQGEIRINMDKTPIEVVIEDEINSGLIIGRDGQTLSSMQYLLNRIVSRKFPGVARIQLDAGDYREKQDEQLRKTAQLLAQKAKTSHRTQSTRPLSSYHRRVVHMALQDDRDILTRSKGDGPMKRVLIMARRKKNAVPPKEPKGAAPTAQPDALEDHQAS